MTDLPPLSGRWVLGALLLIALCLRLYHVDRHGLFFDEKSTLLISQGICLEASNQKDVFGTRYVAPTGDTLYRLRTFTPAEFWKPKTGADFVEANIRGDIGNSPVYYAFLWTWLEVFGLSDLAIRLPSVLFGTLLIALLYAFVRRHIRLKTARQTQGLALLAAALATIEPFFIAQSQVARNYSLTFLLTLAATHVFLIILERSQPVLSGRRSRSNSQMGIFVAYGALFVLSVLCHYLAVTVFLCHGLYALLVLRQGRTWVGLGAVGLAGLGLISLWFVFGGGAYTFQTLAYQAALYKSYALTNPLNNPFGMILPATLPNIISRTTPVLADLLVFTNGLAGAVQGFRNMLLAVGLGVLATGILHRYRAVMNPPAWAKVALAALLVVGLPLYSVVPGRLLVLSAALPLLYLIGLGIGTLPQQATRHRAVFLLMLSVVPTLFLVIMAWRSGHTNGITQRYSGFSFPSVIILISLGLWQLGRLRWWYSAPVLAVLAVQTWFVANLLGLIYAGTEAKYTQFGMARQRNPYWTIAQTIMTQYAPGDTIVYPNRNKVMPTNKMDASFVPASVLDAQLVTVYLPKAAQFAQRIDPNEHDRVFLIKKSTGNRQIIFNLDGLRY